MKLNYQDTFEKNRILALVNEICGRKYLEVTNFVMHNLRRVDTDNDGVITFKELKHFVKSEIAKVKEEMINKLTNHKYEEAKKAEAEKAARKALK